MVEKRREYKERVDAEWRKNEKNKNKLIKKIKEYGLLDERYKKNVEEEILEAFSKEENEAKGENYKRVTEELEKQHEKYETLKQMEEKLEKLESKSVALESDIRGFDLEAEDEIMFNMKEAELKKMENEYSEYEKQIEETKKMVEDAHQEIEAMEDVYGKAVQSEILVEDESTIEPPLFLINADNIEPTTLKEYHDQTIRDLWGKDRKRVEILKILEEGAGIGNELSEKIEKELTERFLKYYEKEQGRLKMKSGRFLKQKLRKREERYEEIKVMSDGEEKKKKLEILERQEKAYGVEPLVEIDRRKEKEIEKEIEIKETRKVLEPLRKLWKENIQLREETKNKIIEAADKIRLKAVKESDGSRMIEMGIGGKIYKILDVNTGKHTDEEYGGSYNYNWVIKGEVKLIGMKGDNVNKRSNQKLKEYVKAKEREGLHMPKKEEMQSLLKELGKEAGLSDRSNQIAMLMYLTGMYGWYWLSSIFYPVGRPVLVCCKGKREFQSPDGYNASLFMIACP